MAQPTHNPDDVARESASRDDDSIIQDDVVSQELVREDDVPDGLIRDDDASTESVASSDASETESSAEPGFEADSFVGASEEIEAGDEEDFESSRSDNDIESEVRQAGAAFGSAGLFRAVGEIAEPQAKPRLISWVVCAGCVVVGAALLFASVLIPARLENRLLESQVRTLETHLNHLKRQAEVDREFLAKVQSDPTLIDRLALRQAGKVPEGMKLLQADTFASGAVESPFAITRVPAPDLSNEVVEVSNLERLFMSNRVRIVALTAGVFLMSAGVLLAPSGAHVARQI